MLLVYVRTTLIVMHCYCIAFEAFCIMSTLDLAAEMGELTVTQDSIFSELEEDKAEEDVGEETGADAGGSPREPAGKALRFPRPR